MTTAVASIASQSPAPPSNKFTLTISAAGVATGAVMGSLVYTTVSSTGKTAAAVAEGSLMVVEKAISMGIGFIAGPIAERVFSQIGGHVIHKVADSMRTTTAITSIASGTVAMVGTAIVITISGYLLTRLGSGSLMLTKATYHKILEALRTRRDVTSSIDIAVVGNDIYIQALEDYVLIGSDDLVGAPIMPDITAGWD